MNVIAIKKFASREPHWTCTKKVGWKLFAGQI